MVMVYVPEGNFMMGSTDDDPLALEDEKPQRKVYLDAYWMDRTEVTQAMFARFLNEMGNQAEGGDTWLDSDDPAVRIVFKDGLWTPLPGYEQHPVVEVTWFGARAYCGWAGRRLSTEAEWEKAARGTDGRIYPWGKGKKAVLQVGCEQANLTGCIGDTEPVESHSDFASPDGILNMAGNVAEWVADWYGEDYYAGGPSRNPQGPANGELRVQRGGGWTGGFRYVRAASRRRSSPSFACLYHGDGFRCAANVTPPTTPAERPYELAH
jgi:formylglycine-generating enzyme required for sulfatase activity